VACNYIRGWEFQMGTMMSVKMLKSDQEQQHVHNIDECLL